MYVEPRGLSGSYTLGMDHDTSLSVMLWVFEAHLLQPDRGFSAQAHPKQALHDTSNEYALISEVRLITRKYGNSLFWPTWTLTQDQNPMHLYKSCYIDPLKCGHGRLPRSGHLPRTLCMVYVKYTPSYGPSIYYAQL